jgi:hypothetical protein
VTIDELSDVVHLGHDHFDRVVSVPDELDRPWFTLPMQHGEPVVESPVFGAASSLVETGSGE